MHYILCFLKYTCLLIFSYFIKMLLFPLKICSLILLYLSVQKKRQSLSMNLNAAVTPCSLQECNGFPNAVACQFPSRRRVKTMSNLMTSNCRKPFSFELRQKCNSHITVPPVQMVKDMDSSRSLKGTGSFFSAALPFPDVMLLSVTKPESLSRLCYSP